MHVIKYDHFCTQAKYFNACLKQELRDLEVMENEYKQFSELLTSFHKTCTEAGGKYQQQTGCFKSRRLPTPLINTISKHLLCFLDCSDTVAWSMTVSK